MKNSIYRGEEYIDKKEVIKYLAENRLDFSINSRRERFAYHLLNKITYGSAFQFYKGQLSECWYKDCCLHAFPKRCGIKDNVNRAKGRLKLLKVFHMSVIDNNTELKETLKI